MWLSLASQWAESTSPPLDFGFRMWFALANGILAGVTQQRLEMLSRGTAWAPALSCCCEKNILRLVHRFQEEDEGRMVPSQDAPA